MGDIMLILTLAQSTSNLGAGEIILTFILLLIIIPLLLAIFSGLIRWVFGTSTIISQQKKIIELLEKLSAQKLKE